MRTEIRTKGLDISEDLRDQVERRLRFALSRFASQIRQVEVQVADDEGLDKRCAITVHFNRGGEVFLAERCSRVEASVGRAANRVARQVANQLDRRHTRRSGVFRAVG